MANASSSGDAVLGMCVQLAQETRDDVRHLRKMADELARDHSDLRERVAVLEAAKSRPAPASVGALTGAKRDVGLVAGSSALVAGIVELIRLLS